METSGLPVPDAVQPLLEQLQEALVLEIKYQPNLQLPSTPSTNRCMPFNDDDENEEVTIEHRDASAYVLRCLKVWFELPSEVLFNAINLMDRFLTKMKARKKHMACISVSAFNIAAVEMAQQPLDVDFLVAISQCKCTSGDLKRMSEVIRSKLEWTPGSQPVTALTFLRIYYLMLHAVATQIGLGDLYAELVQESELLVYMENVACDGNCASMKQSEVALVLMFMFVNDVVKSLQEGKFKKQVDPKAEDVNNVNIELLRERAPELLKLNAFVDDFKKLCKISDANFIATHESVSAILRKYNGQQHIPYKQRLIWKLSSRTARLLRPTDKLTSVLPSIAEHPSPKRIRRNRKFPRLQSLQNFQGLQGIPGIENLQVHKWR